MFQIYINFTLIVNPHKQHIAYQSIQKIHWRWNSTNKDQAEFHAILASSVLSFSILDLREQSKNSVPA